MFSYFELNVLLKHLYRLVRTPTARRDDRTSPTEVRCGLSPSRAQVPWSHRRAHEGHNLRSDILWHAPGDGRLLQSFPDAWPRSQAWGRSHVLTSAPLAPRKLILRRLTLCHARGVLVGGWEWLACRDRLLPHPACRPAPLRRLADVTDVTARGASRQLREALMLRFWQVARVQRKDVAPLRRGRQREGDAQLEARDQRRIEVLPKRGGRSKLRRAAQVTTRVPGDSGPRKSRVS